MTLGERINALRTPLLGGGARRDAEEQQRLLKLYWNRAELKKELARLDDQVYQLRDRIKQQEAATQRVDDELEALHTLLGNPERGFGALVHFQLRGLWRACHVLLAQFAHELARQQEDRERKRQLVEFHQDRQARVKVAEQRVAEAAAAAAAEQDGLAELERQHGALRGFWHYFRRRRLVEEIAGRSARTGRARQYLADMAASKQAIEKEPWPEFGGISIDGRRAINIAVLAYAQLLYARLADVNLAAPARSASEKSVHEADYGARDECVALMASVAAALVAVHTQKDLATEIRTRSEGLRTAVRYRHAEDAFPDERSLPSAFPGRAVSLREANVLSDNYWDVSAVLLR